MEEVANTPATLRDAEALLQKHWGHPYFRPGQERGVEAVLEGRDVFTILPTGGGKSICYQVPALLLDGLTLVVSPLIALMQDQVEGLEARGVKAAYINSTLSRRQIDQRWTDAEFGRYDLLYVAPERLQSDLFQARAERVPVTRLAVDEAHCVSQWGHHFRPAYLQIAEARERLGNPPTLAVTATATPEVRRDVARQLKLRDPVHVVHGFDRPNLLWSIFRTENKRAKALEVVRRVDGSGILYAATRRGVETWAAWLRARGETAAHYHGGMKSAERESVQQQWIAGATRLMVATNAFGMGIDKPDVRFVLHIDVPGSLEAYYQEAGRAGRDGDRAHAVLLYHPSDAGLQRRLIEASHPSAKAMQQVYTAACNLAQIPLGVQPDGPVSVNLEAVERLTGAPRSMVTTALRLLEREEAWQVLPRRRHHGLLRFELPADRLRRHAEALDNPALATFVQTLLRTVHADAFSGWWGFDLRLLERRTELGRARLLKGMAFLRDRGWLEWRPPGEAAQVELMMPRTRKLPIDGRAVKRARRRAEKRLGDMLGYARSLTCRRHFLLTYFGETGAARCGRCDVCLGRHRPTVVTPSDEPLLRRILRAVGREAFDPDGFDPAPAYRIGGLVDWLAAEGYLRLEDPLKQRFSLTDKGLRFVKRDA